MASTAVSQLGEARECFDCEAGSPSGQHQAARINSSQKKRRAMDFTMAFVFGYLIGVMDFGSLLEGLGLEPAIQRHGVVPTNVLSVDLDCISSRRKAKHENFEECTWTSGNSSQVNRIMANDFRWDLSWIEQAMSMFAHGPSPRASHPSSAAFNSQPRPTHAGEHHQSSAVTSVDHANVREPAVKAIRNPLKSVLAGTAAATLMSPMAASAKAVAKFGEMADHSKDGISIFNNMRTPAALVAGACLSLAFALPKPDKDDSKTMRRFKRANVLLGFASVTSQLVSVIFATNAINRLTEHAGTVETMARSLGELLKKDMFAQFWLGVYIHFIVGLVGMLAMVSFRAWYFMGPAYTRPVAAIAVAIGFRLLSAINRGVVVTEFGAGPGGSNFLYLVINYLWVTMRSAWHHRRIADMLSFVSAAAACVFFGKSMRSHRDDLNEATSEAN